MQFSGMRDLIAPLVILCVCAWGTNIYAAEPKPDWQSDWEKIVQGAKKEGKLSLYLYQGGGELEAVAQLFQKKYPEINVVTTPGRGNTLAPRVMAERHAVDLAVKVRRYGRKTLLSAGTC